MQNQHDEAAINTLRVCLVAEGGYPFYSGGVSNWCHSLITGLPDIRFTVMSITALPDRRSLFTLPPNVESLIAVPLWGMYGDFERHKDLPIREILRKKSRASAHVIEREFIPLFSRFIDALWSADNTAAEFSQTLCEMSEYFQTYDYDTTFQSMEVWNTYRSDVAARDLNTETGDFTAGNIPLLSVTNTMTLIYRWLMILDLPIPDVDVIHASSGGLCSIPGIVGAQSGKTAFVLSEHGIYLRESLLALTRSKATRFEQMFQAAFNQKVAEAGYLCAGKVVPCCKYNHRWQLRNGAPREKLKTIYTGSDPAEFGPLPGRRKESDRPNIIWLGRIDPLKDLETLIRAASLVHIEVPEARFVLYGPTPAGNEWYRDKCIALRDDLGLAEAVEFSGFAESARSAYNEGDFVVLSSISEGFPYSMVEAMMCGRTIVGTNVGGVSEALEDVGYVVEPRNPEQMASAILKLIYEPKVAEELGKKAREKALRHFNMLESNGAYLSVYRELYSTMIAPVSQDHSEDSALEEREA